MFIIMTNTGHNGKILMIFKTNRKDFKTNSVQTIHKKRKDFKMKSVKTIPKKRTI